MVRHQGEIWFARLAICTCGLHCDFGLPKVISRICSFTPLLGACSDHFVQKGRLRCCTQVVANQSGNEYGVE